MYYCQRPSRGRGYNRNQRTQLILELPQEESSSPKSMLGMQYKFFKFWINPCLNLCCFVLYILKPLSERERRTVFRRIFLEWTLGHVHSREQFDRSRHQPSVHCHTPGEYLQQVWEIEHSVTWFVPSFVDVNNVVPQGSLSRDCYTTSNNTWCQNKTRGIYLWSYLPRNMGWVSWYLIG